MLNRANVILILVLTAGIPTISIAQTFVEECLGSTGILTKELICSSDSAQVILRSGETLTVQRKGDLRPTPFLVKRIQHLPDRIADTGFMDESVKFIASSGKKSCTLEIPCHQSAIAYLQITFDSRLASEDSIVGCK